MTAADPNRPPRASLLERASDWFDYAPPPPVAAPRHDPVPLPSEPAPAAETPAFAPLPVTRERVAIDRERLVERGMLVPGAAVTPLAEEFRLIKRQLLLAADEAATTDAVKARAILVCSARPGDGKTFSATNLALSLAAERDVEVLLVDADVAKPDVPRVLGFDDGPGLLDAIGDPALDVEGLVLDTDIPQLQILRAGTRGHADTELLASGAARQVIGGLARANPRRIVLFDSPPVLAASPAGVLAGLVGQVMLVVRADRTSESDLREAVGQLGACERVSLVLNSVSLRPGGNRYGDYYAYGSEA
ncbi:exopolysaccharide biosynthesis protein [Sphingomonas spermidinifaciens]|uniref:Exopolysaccharide biosynthesis protein n=1 Tax=Sphingomonas spermidinifaciens TaxID=1141889 RepID=A0A2A4B9U8_9SPHN|nr:P-loop NTPase [Sphingomonas spermidinifaciens]PCD04695.1 exopolysaccharide biosynthesis protein [Sphingomonas spermidinifaciens]